MATLKSAVFCSSAMLIWRRTTPTDSNCPHAPCFCLRKFILLPFFSQFTSLHRSAFNGHIEVCRLLVESKADVAARTKCFSPPPSHHLSLTICLAAKAILHSNWPSTELNTPRLPTLLRTCAASARRYDAPTCKRGCV